MDLHVGDSQRRKLSLSAPRSLSLGLDLEASADQGANCAQATARGRHPIVLLEDALFSMEMASWNSGLPVAGTSTSPDHERHADIAVIFAFFSRYARIARYAQSIGRDFAR